MFIKYTRSTNINIKSRRNSKINWSRLPNLWKIDFLSWAARLSCHFSVTLGVLVHLVWIRPLKRSIVRHSRSVIIIRDEWHCQWWNDELIGNNGRSLPNRNTADLTMINERMNDRTNNQWKRKMEQTTTNRIKENRRKRWKITYYIMIAILHSIQCNESATSRTHTHKHPDHFFEMQTAIYLEVCVWKMWMRKVNSARQTRHGSFQNIQPFNNKLYSSCWILLRQKKKRKYSSVCATAAGDGTKIIRKVKRAKAYAVQVVLFMFFTYYTAIAQHFNEDRNLFDWALESFVCVCASHEWVFIGIFVIPHSTALKWNSECDQ